MDEMKNFEIIVADALYDFDKEISQRVVECVLTLRPDFAMVLAGKAKIVTNKIYDTIKDQPEYETFSTF